MSGENLQRFYDRSLFTFEAEDHHYKDDYVKKESFIKAHTASVYNYSNHLVDICRFPTNVDPPCSLECHFQFNAGIVHPWSNLAPRTFLEMHQTVALHCLECSRKV